MMRKAILVAVGAMLCGCQTPTATSNALAIALTFDDLPVHGDAPAGETALSTVATMISVLEKQKITAHGFANGHWVVEQPPTAAALAQWRQSGLPLGNHGWSHRSLDSITVGQFEDELLRNEPLLKTAGNSGWRWFRFPFLHEGKDPAARAAARNVLARRGYRIAPVTMDFSDWQWTAPYARCTAKGDGAAIALLEKNYIEAARESVARSRQLSRDLYGHDVPYILLLHVGGMTAHMLPQLLELYRDERFRFVTLDEAASHPIYRADTNPALSAGPTSLDQRAAAAKVAIPERTDRGPALEKLCAATP